MTQKAFLWDLTGGSTYAPYDDTEFNSIVTFSQFSTVSDFTLNSNHVIVPGYLDDLKVVGNDSSSIYVMPGAAIVKGYTYINTETVALPVSPVSSGNYRRDTVVLRLDYEAKTVRLAVLEGNEGVTFALPTLTQIDGDIWEIALANIFVEYFNPFYVPSAMVADQRGFIFTHKHPAIAEYNLIRNSEFMAFSGAQTAPVDPPECWDFPVTPSACAAGTAYEPMTRGRTVTLNAASAMTQRVYIGGKKTFTLKMCLFSAARTQSGAYYDVYPYRSDGTLVDETISRTVVTEGSAMVAKLIQETFTFESDEIAYLVLKLSTALTPVNFGQVILVEGYHPGPFRPFTEFIPLRSGLTDASWNTTAKSDGTTTIDLTASFGGYVLPGTKAVLVNAIVRDSGTGANANVTLSFSSVLSAVNCGILDIGSITNDAFRSGQFIVPVDTDLFSAAPAKTPRFDVTVDATGAATMDVLLYIVGIYV